MGNDVDAEVLARDTAVEVAVEQKQADWTHEDEPDGRHSGESYNLEHIAETEQHL